MDPLTLMIIGTALSGLTSLFGAGQERRQDEAKIEYERAQREAEAQAYERNREMWLEQVAQMEATTGSRVAAIEAGRDYAGLDASMGAEYTRNINALRAQAGASGMTGSGVEQAAIMGALGQAIAASAQARLSDDLNRQQLMGGSEQALSGLVSQILSQPSFSAPTGEEATAGLDALAGGLGNPLMAGLMGALGGAAQFLPFLGGGGGGALPSGSGVGASKSGAVASGANKGGALPSGVSGLGDVNTLGNLLGILSGVGGASSGGGFGVDRSNVKFKE